MKQKRAEERLIKAIPHIRLHEGNRGKIAALDAVWLEYRALCQTYVTHFCTVASPDKHAALLYASPLSARWQRVAIQQAAGIAQAWLSKRREAADEFLAWLARYEALPVAEQAKKPRPRWKEWRIPELQTVCIQANANVVETWTDIDPALNITPAERGNFDYWLQIATLEWRKPIYLPVKLADYHKKALGKHIPNRSVTLNRRKGVWWLTLTIDTALPDPLVSTDIRAADVGISNFISDNTDQRYGTFRGDLAQHHQQDRAKRQRKAQLRACLEKKGLEKLPSTSSATGQRLARRVRQEINRAVNLFLDECKHSIICLEALSVSTMHFKARRMNAYLYASNLAHIPKQIAWGAAKRGIPVVYVNPAYSSQACPHCQFTARANRPMQQTFCCQVCGYTAHADLVGARNLASRVHDSDLSACRSLEAVKKLLAARHARWRHEHGYP
jgi:IS605 OrfB family transposase